MYTFKNYKTKEALIEDVVNGTEVRIFQPNDMFNNPKGAPNYTGSAVVEGPHYPEAHKWYATVEMKDGIVMKVK